MRPPTAATPRMRISFVRSPLRRKEMTRKETKKITFVALLFAAVVGTVFGLLTFFLSDFCGGKRLDIYGRSREGETVERQLRHLFSRPLWPVGLRDYSGIKIVCHELEGEIKAGPFRITWMESQHPGGAVNYRVDAGGKSIVLATDFEHSKGSEERLVAFSKDADLLLYDGQYTEKEYPTFRGFGHSTPETGLQVFRKSGAKRMRIVHHAPDATDEELNRRERLLKAQEPNTGFARQGEILEL